MLNRSGVLEFRHEESVAPGEHGVWIRALFRMPKAEDLPALPPVSHLLLNSVDSVNLHEFRMEKFSGEGIPNQSFTLRRSPVYLHPEEGGNGFAPDRFPDIRVYVTEEDGERREWRRAPGNSLLTTSKDDRVFVVDPIEGTLAFGNGIRGRILPVGSYNVSVDVYHVVPGDAGNVGVAQIAVCEGFGDMVTVANKLPSTGGRNPETIEEIIRRAPSVLTSRDRAVTRLDFEVIAKEASAEVARAACDGRMTYDGEVEVVCLPQRREDEVVPDPFLSAGLKEYVQKYLSRRCLVNVRPVVRLATFQQVDVSLVLRLRPNANFMLVREQARAWVRKFLDPYTGGLDAQGWPFGGTLYAQDFARMVTDLPEVRHVVEVQVYESSNDGTGSPGWERGSGVQTLVLDTKDLFVIRHVRVVSEEGEA
jgi:predicted phage baseplate assembly protein